MLIIIAAATLLLQGEWVKAPPPPPSPKMSALDMALQPTPSTQTLEVHYSCILGVTDPHDGSTACLVYESFGAESTDIAKLIISAEGNTKSGDCIVGVKDPHDGSTICAARKE